MVYVLKIPSNVFIRTSLLQIIFLTANVTLLQYITTQSVDVVLAILLLVGTVVGARLKGEHQQAFLAWIILAVSGGSASI